MNRKIMAMAILSGWLACLPAAADDLRLAFIPGSATKLEQLLGDFDKSIQKPTANLTRQRAGLEGADLGYSFEFNGKIVFLFGDSIGPGGGDAIGWSASTDPEKGLALDLYRGSDRHYLKVAPAGVSMKGFEVPVCGIAVNGVPYVWVKTGRDSGSEHSLLTRFDEKRQTFTIVREFSRSPAGRFIEMTAHRYTGSIPGIPGAGPFVIVMGAAEYRKSSPYLCVIPEADFETGANTRFYAGADAAGLLRWGDSEGDATAVFNHPTIGNLSLTWCEGIKQWLLVYDSRDPRGILLRHAPHPWGPWSGPEVIFEARRDNASGRFIHEVKPGASDGLAGPVIGAKKNQVESVPGGAYAPFVIERFTRSDGRTVTVYFLLSTWNPYTVVLMRAALAIEAGGQ